MRRLGRQNDRHGLGWMGATSALASAVRKAKTPAVGLVLLGAFRTDVQLVQMPANTASRRSSSRANHTGAFLPSIPVQYSDNDVNGTMQRFAGAR